MLCLQYKKQKATTLLFHCFSQQNIDLIDVRFDMFGPSQKLVLKYCYTILYFISTKLCACACVCACMHVFVCVCVFVCACVFDCKKSQIIWTTFFQFHGTISLEFSASQSKKYTNTVSIQIAAKNLVCPGLPVESEEICVCVWQLNVDGCIWIVRGGRERGGGGRA